MNSAALPTTKKHVLRIAVGAVFFIAGLIFASWASRIATIQQELGLNDAQLGGMLFSIPVGLMLSLPFSGWIITKVGSRTVLAFALVAYSITLAGLGSAAHIYQLIACLVLFGFASNAVNISVNTQAVAAEQLYKRPILASFHGLWSLAGFTGAGIGTLMIGKGITPLYHFCIIMLLAMAGTLFSYRYLAHDKGPADDTPAFAWPDRSLFKLGIIAFCSLICEGAMFDWSVIYFKKIVLAPGAWIGAGYTAFMCTMATGRFFADYFAHRVGIKVTQPRSGLLTATGLFVAVLFPHLYTAILGFMLVGFGVSSVVPLIYSTAGKSATMPAGMALAAVSTIGFAGFLAGPPLIGFLAGAFSLRVSFTLIAVMGLCVTAIATKAKLN